MFIIHCGNNLVSLRHALFILSYYKVGFHTISNGTNSESVSIVADHEFKEHQLRLAEMAFQSEFAQASGNVCSICADKGEEFCGHIVFRHIV